MYWEVFMYELLWELAHNPSRPLRKSDLRNKLSAYSVLLL